MNDEEKSIASTAQFIKSSQNILFITGAGISADSGIPTYRGVGGLYDCESTDEGVSIEQALSGSMMQTNPQLTWKYLWQIGAACSGASYNQAHAVLAAIQKSKPGSWILTQNVDGLHRQAGSINLIEIHGHAYDLFCTNCAFQANAKIFLSDFDTDYISVPQCPHCEAVLRPDVVLFGEILPEEAVRKLVDLQSKKMDLVMSIGTSGRFPYIVEPIVLARQKNTPTVEINPADTEISHLFDFHIRLGAAEAMSRISTSLHELVQKS